MSTLEPNTAVAVDDTSASIQIVELEHSVVLPGWRHFARYIRRQVITSLPIAIVDQLAIGISLMAAWGLMSLVVGAMWVRPLNLYLPMAIATSLVFGIAKLYPAIGLSASEELQRAFYSFSGLIASFVVVVVAFIPNPSSFLWLLFGTFVGTSVVLPMLRIWIRGYLGKSKWWGQPILILGGGLRSRGLQSIAATSGTGASSNRYSGRRLRSALATRRGGPHLVFGNTERSDRISRTARRVLGGGGDRGADNR